MGNFLQHNPGAANQQNDSDYAGNSLRTAGIGVNAILPSVWLNKLFYQVTTFVTAFSAALAAKGVTNGDSSLSTLTTALGQVAVLADVNNAVSGEATARTNAISAEAAARTNADAGLQGGINAINSPNQTFSASGHVSLPGGMYLQWFPAVTVTESGDSIHAVTFPFAFPSNCFSVQVTTATNQGGPGSAGDTDIHTWQLTGTPTNTGCNVRHSVGGVYGQSQTLTAIIFAVGN